MPEMDGFEATHIIRNELKKDQLPIIAMTAHAMKGDREKCLSHGMDDYIRKPVDPDDLINILIKWISNNSKNKKAETISIETNESQDLPILDIKEGANRVAGNKQLYYSLLQRFSKNHDKDLQEIIDTIRENNIPKAIKMVHNIKGLAGNLSVKRLLKTSSELEFVLKKQEVDRYDIILKDFQNTFDEAIRNINSLKK